MDRCKRRIMDGFHDRGCSRKPLSGEEYCSIHRVLTKDVKTESWWGVPKFFHSDDIEKIEVVSLTSKTLSYLRPDGTIRIVNRSTQYTEYFPSFKDAHNFKIELVAEEKRLLLGKGG